MLASLCLWLLLKRSLASYLISFLCINIYQFYSISWFSPFGSFLYFRFRSVYSFVTLLSCSYKESINFNILSNIRSASNSLFTNSGRCFLCKIFALTMIFLKYSYSFSSVDILVILSIVLSISIGSWIFAYI